MVPLNLTLAEMENFSAGLWFPGSFYWERVVGSIPPLVIRCSGSRGMRKDETSYGHDVTMSVASTDAHENAGVAMLKTFLSAKN